MKKKTKPKIHVRKGDFIKVISGNDKGKVGQIIKVLYKSSKVLVENVNIRMKHIKPNQKIEKGQIIKVEVPIHSSNVMLYSQTKQIASKYGCVIQNNKNSTKQRLLKKTQEII